MDKEAAVGAVAVRVWPRHRLSACWPSPMAVPPVRARRSGPPGLGGVGRVRQTLSARPLGRAKRMERAPRGPPRRALGRLPLGSSP